MDLLGLEGRREKGRARQRTTRKDEEHIGIEKRERGGMEERNVQACLP